MMFVHLAPERRVKSIVRNGINQLRKHKAGILGVFAMPVVRGFFVSHQWLRELKRRSQGAIAGIYFRIVVRPRNFPGKTKPDEVLRLKQFENLSNRTLPR